MCCKLTVFSLLATAMSLYGQPPLKASQPLCSNAGNSSSLWAVFLWPMSS